MSECISHTALVELAEEEKKMSDGFNILGLFLFGDLRGEERSVERKKTTNIPYHEFHWRCITLIWKEL